MAGCVPSLDATVHGRSPDSEWSPKPTDRIQIPRTPEGPHRIFGELKQSRLGSHWLPPGSLPPDLLPPLM